MSRAVKRCSGFGPARLQRAPPAARGRRRAAAHASSPDTATLEAGEWLWVFRTSPTTLASPAATPFPHRIPCNNLPVDIIRVIGSLQAP